MDCLDVASDFMPLLLATQTGGGSFLTETRCRCRCLDRGWAGETFHLVRGFGRQVVRSP